MATPYLGQIILVGYNYAQRGFALCQGQKLAIAQFTALFSLLGTKFGGDGRVHFNLPNLSGRTAIGQGQGSGLSARGIGQTGGVEKNVLTTNQMPAHTHTATMHAEGAAASSSTPTNNLLAEATVYATPGRAGNVALSSQSITVSTVGGNQSVDNMPPFLVLNYEIALQGSFPSRS